MELFLLQFGHNALDALLTALLALPGAAGLALVLSKVMHKRPIVLFGAAEVVCAAAAVCLLWKRIAYNSCSVWLLSILVCLVILAADRLLKRRSG